ncbi:MAG: response regulator transcription factor [Actinomycetota bacterium]
MAHRKHIVTKGEGTKRVEIRVLLADDHAILREGLSSLMEKQEDIVVVGEATDGQECLEKTDLLRPDLVVMDIKLPGKSGIETCRLLKARFPEMKVVVLSMYEDFEYVSRALQAGADGYILKKAAGSELVQAVRMVVRGEKAFSPQVLDMIVASVREEGRAAAGIGPLDSLTSREYDVLAMMSEGMSNKDIASQLLLSPKTVEKIISGMYRKLGVASRTAAIKLFLDSKT